MRITALAGGVGGARFLRGLLRHLDSAHLGRDRHEVVVIGNTGDDITLHGLRVCPDLDTIMYTLGGGVHESQGWGRTDEQTTVAEELAAYGAQPQWFTLGDRDLATHLVRTRMLNLGYPLSQVTEALCERWRPGVRLLPMSDDAVETHIVIDDPAAEGGRRAVHFQEWWVRLHAAVPARQILAVGLERAAPAPGVLEALRDADVVLLPPSNPVVSIGTILALPGVRETLRGTRAPVVGVSPIIGGAPVRGMADACLQAIGVETSAAGVAGLYADFLGGWLVAEADHRPGPRPAAVVGPAAGSGMAPPTGAGGPTAAMPPGPVIRGRPLLMSDLDAAEQLAGAALTLALELAGGTAGAGRDAGRTADLAG